mgnify:CR=1
MATEGNADGPPPLGRFQSVRFMQWAPGAGQSVIATELGCGINIQLRETKGPRPPQHRSQFNLSR